MCQEVRGGPKYTTKPFVCWVNYMPSPSFCVSASSAQRLRHLKLWRAVNTLVPFPDWDPEDVWLKGLAEFPNKIMSSHWPSELRILLPHQPSSPNTLVDQQTGTQRQL
jgi:hypothetical protein